MRYFEFFLACVLLCLIKSGHIAVVRCFVVAYSVEYGVDSYILCPEMSYFILTAYLHAELNSLLPWCCRYNAYIPIRRSFLHFQEVTFATTN